MLSSAHCHAPITLEAVLGWELDLGDDLRTYLEVGCIGESVERMSEGRDEKDGYSLLVSDRGRDASTFMRLKFECDLRTAARRREKGGTWEVLCFKGH